MKRIVCTVEKPRKRKMDAEYSRIFQSCYQTPVCAISKDNLVAIATTEQVHGAKGKGKSWNIETRLDIMTLEQPNIRHKVMTFQHPVVELAFEPHTNQLLVVDIIGVVQVYRQREHCINHWDVVKVVERGTDIDRVVKVDWLPVVGAPDTSSAEGEDNRRDDDDNEENGDDNAKLGHEYSLLGSGDPILSDIIPFICVSSAGQVVVENISNRFGDVSSIRASLGHRRLLISSASFCFLPDGSVLLAVVGGEPLTPVTCYHLRLDGSLLCEPVLVFRPQALSYTDTSKPAPSSTAITVMFRQRQASRYMTELVVGVGDGDVARKVEVWVVERLEHGENAGVWERVFKGQVLPPDGEGVAITGMCALPSSDHLPHLPHILLATTQSQLVAYEWQAHDGGDDDGDTPPTSGYAECWSQATPSPLSTLCLSASASATVAIDKTGDVLLILRNLILTSTDGVAKVLLRAGVCGVSPVDTLTCVEPSSLHSVAEEMLRDIGGYAGGDDDADVSILHTHNMYASQVLALLYRMAGEANHLTHEMVKLQLYHTAACCYSLLPPAEPPVYYHLRTLLTSSSETRLDKVIIALNPTTKEFYVEPNLLSSLQRHIQWFSDLTLHLIVGYSAIFLHQQQQQQQPIDNDHFILLLVRDVEVMEVLRQLLVLIKVWTLYKPTCMPAYKQYVDSVDVDILTRTFQLLTRLLSLTASSDTLDDAFLADVTQLTHDVRLRPVDIMNKINPHAIAAYESDDSVSVMRDDGRFPQASDMVEQVARLYTLYMTSNTLSVSMIMDGKGIVDSIRHFELAANPSYHLKQCCRCSSLTVASGDGHAYGLMSYAWENQLSKYCLCGGVWMAKSLV